MSFHELPVLTGEHVTLTPLVPEHAPGLLAAADDDEVFRWLTALRPRDLGEAERFVAHRLTMAPGVITWAQTVTATGEVAGVTSFYDIDESLRTVAIGHTWLGRRFWRTGLNTESKLLLLARAFDTLGCVRVVWHTDLRNERSQAAIARLGATREGVLRRHKRRPDGTWRDTVVYSLLDDEWPTARERLMSGAARRTLP